MSETRKKKIRLRWLLLIIALAFIDFALILLYLLQDKNIAVLNPKGVIAQGQLNLLIHVTIVLLAIGIPSLLVLYFVAWRYRESGTKAMYRPVAQNSKKLVVAMWVIPTVFALIIGLILVPATHKLAPQKTIASDEKPLTIQVISMRWKWLFIYPDQGIATVNYVQIPINTPVTFNLTADEAPMSSFWIPNLGGQLYAMTSHTNRLNLMADSLGDFPGSTPEITGAGFTGMKFTTRVSTPEAFDQWAQEVKHSSEVLDTTAYEKLLLPSKSNPVVLYSAYENNLYSNVIRKYMDPSGHSHSPNTSKEGHPHE